MEKKKQTNPQDAVLLAKMSCQAEGKKDYQEPNKPLFHLRITLYKVSQHDIEIN